MSLLMSCGSSSRLKRRSTAPILVIRGSRARVHCGWPLADASALIDRNLWRRNERPSMPVRTWVKNTGPPSSRLMSQAMIGNIQPVSRSSTAATARSKERLTIWFQPSSGIWERLMTGRPSRSSTPARST
jgi:hypothetical protein